MKLIVQIPCFNEEKTLPETVRDIPRKIEGIDSVEILIIDDGSTDRTVAVARELGVDHVLQNTGNKGWLLVNNGADAGIENSCGDSPRSVAQKKRYSEILSLLDAVE